MSEDYNTGYGKPPKRSRFQKGRSGNPKGRPKGRKNKGSVVREVIERKVTIRENGKTRKVTVFEALVESMVSKALNGSINDQIKLIQLIEKHVPEKLEDMKKFDQAITVTYVLPDGKTMESYDNDQTTASRHDPVAMAGNDSGKPDADADLEAAWKAAGLDDEEGEAPAE